MAATMAALAHLLAGPVFAGDYERLAADMARAALRHGKRRVAVLPFQGLPGGERFSGLVVSERLTRCLLAAGGLEVVERTLLESVVQEQRLGFSGAFNPRSVKELGRILGVDVVVTGTALLLNGGRLEVNARMIDAETARVLAAGAARVDKDWAEPGMGALDPWQVPVPPLPRFDASEPLSEPDCLVQARDIEQGDRSLLDVKARYWALRLRDNEFSRASLTQNPGSEIRDPETRRRFYRRLRQWHEEDQVAALSEEEGRALARHEQDSRSFKSACGQH